MAIVMIAFNTFNLAAQDQPADSLIRHFMQRWHIRGGAAAVTKDGQMIYSKGFGTSDLARERETRHSDLFRIASLSKPVTAIAIMKLAEAHKLSLDEKLFGKGRLLDEPYYADVILDPSVYQITIRHLLEHTAGWDRRVDAEDYGAGDPPFAPLLVTRVEAAPNPAGDSTLIRFALRRGLNYEPGSTYSYSNVGYLILGKVIEKVSGQKYEDFVQNEILHPIGIYDMKLGRNLREDRFENEVEYFSDHNTLSCYGDGNMVPWQYGGFNLEAMNAHGGWIASAPDLCKLLLAVDGFDTSPDILNKNSLREMTKVDLKNSPYAKGWFVNERGNWWHTGSLDGSSAFFCRTANGYTWTFLFNSRGDNSQEFWNSLDRLPWDCINNMEVPVTQDLHVQRI